MTSICKENEICGRKDNLNRELRCNPGAYVTGIETDHFKRDNFGVFGSVTLFCSDSKSTRTHSTNNWNKNNSYDGWHISCPKGIKRLGMNFGRDGLHRFGYICADESDGFLNGFINTINNGDTTSVSPEGKVLTGLDVYTNDDWVNGIKPIYDLNDPTTQQINTTEKNINKNNPNILKPYILLSNEAFLLGPKYRPNKDNSIVNVNTPGKYPNMNMINMKPNTVSSIYISKGAVGTFYSHPGLTKNSIKVMGPSYIGFLQRIGWNDEIDSFNFEVVKDGQGKYKDPLVTMYESFNLSPTSSFVSINELGSYPNVELIGFDDNTLKSLYVAPGVRVILYKHFTFGGESVTIIGPKKINNISDVGFPINELSSIMVQLVEEDKQDIVSANVKSRNLNQTCPKIGGTTGRPIQIGENIKCSYNVRDFKDGNDIDIWLKPESKRNPDTGKSYDKWIEKNDVINKGWDEKIMPYFCSQTSTSCPPGLVDPKTKKPTSICSNFVSTDNNGKKCREWVDTQGDRGSSTADSAMVTYCTTKDYTPDCLCIAPGRDTSQAARFLEETLTNKTPKACWWVPCGDPANYIVPVIDPRFQAKGKCPTVSCNQYTKILGNQNTQVDIGSIKSYINCSATVKDGEVTLNKQESGTVQQGKQTTTPTGTTTTGSQIGNTPTGQTKKGGSSVIPIISIVGVLFLIIIIGIIIFFVIRSRKPKTP